MGSKGERTRREILKIAQGLVLNRGFGATSIERIIEEAGITKGGFFYHFDGKNDLARQLMVQYLEDDDVFFRTLVDQACDLSEDPLQQFLLFLKLMADAMSNLPEAHPGCLVASFTYESQLLNEDVHALVVEGLVAWRKIFGDLIESVLAHREPALPVDPLALADMLTTTIEGGIVMSRAFGDQQVLADQIMQYRSYVRMLFGAI